MTGLEALKNIKREAGTPYFSTLYDIDMWREDFATVEKELKVLDIIKNKCVDIRWVLVEKPFINTTYALTQEEIDLLKEVFGDEILGK